jgi:hypothetical protein
MVSCHTLARPDAERERDRERERERERDVSLMNIAII